MNQYRFKRIYMIKKRKSKYATEEWVKNIVSNPNLTDADYRRFIADLHRTKNFRALKLLQWALKKKSKGEWVYE